MVGEKLSTLRSKKIWCKGTQLDIKVSLAVMAITSINYLWHKTIAKNNKPSKIREPSITDDQLHALGSTSAKEKLEASRSQLKKSGWKPETRLMLWDTIFSTAAKNEDAAIKHYHELWWFGIKLGISANIAISWMVKFRVAQSVERPKGPSLVQLYWREFESWSWHSSLERL